MEPWLMRIALTTAEYIKALPDKTRITLLEAIEQACPGQAMGLGYKDLSDVYAAIEKALNGTNVLLDMSEHGNNLEELMGDPDFVVRKERLIKARLTSNMVCGDREPPAGTLIRQRLAVTAEERAFFSEALQGGKAGRRIRMTIDRDVAASILSMLADLAEAALDGEDGKDAAWELALTAPGGIKKAAQRHRGYEGRGGWAGPVCLYSHQSSDRGNGVVWEAAGAWRDLKAWERLQEDLRILLWQMRIKSKN